MKRSVESSSVSSVRWWEGLERSSRDSSRLPLRAVCGFVVFFLAQTAYSSRFSPPALQLDTQMDGPSLLIMSLLKRLTTKHSSCVPLHAHRGPTPDTQADQSQIPG
ncbi:hypothetical protein AMECASPLE_016891 [Ameca splendens]|uniref:Uncharacterized protein n=1 Tax=Ameca splendens TaxID=208324 RepID=A0ABV0YP92_9TELE